MWRGGSERNHEDEGRFGWEAGLGKVNVTRGLPKKANPTEVVVLSQKVCSGVAGEWERLGARVQGVYGRGLGGVEKSHRRQGWEGKG